MLELLRKSTNTLPFKIFFVILIASFGFWGMDALRDRGPGTNVASVGSQSISIVEYDRALRLQLEKAKEIVKNQVPAAALISMVQPQVYQQLVQQKLLNALAQDMELNVSDKVIKEAILKQYLTDDESFDPKKFKLMLSRAGYSEKQFIEIIKKELERSFIAGAIFPSIFVPQVFIKTIHKDYYTPRTYQAIIISEKNINVKKAVKETDLQNFYALHKSKYMLPELRTVEAFIFSPDMYKNKIREQEKGLSDSEVQQAAIEENHQLTQEIEDQLAGGMTFSEISKKYKLPIYTAANIDSNGNIIEKNKKNTTNSFITADMLETAFELEAGIESDTRALADGRTYIIKVKDIKEKRIPTFKEVKEKVKADYIAHLKKNALKKELEISLAALKKGSTTLKSLAKKRNLRVQTFSDIRATKKLPAALTVEVAEEILKQPKKKYFGLISDGKAYIGLVTKTSNMPIVSKERHKENLEAIGKSLRAAIAGAFLRAIMDDLKKNHPVVTNNKIIESILSHYS